MEGVITEIDNNIFQNMKNLSYIKYRKKIFNKMRFYKDSNKKFKHIFSASNINPKSDRTNKIFMSKSNSNLRQKRIKPYKDRMNSTSMSIFSKKLMMKKTLQNFNNKQKEDASTSLSSLIKTSSSFFNSTNFNFNSAKKKLNFNNITNTNIINKRKQLDFQESHSFIIPFDKYINDFLHVNKFCPKEESKQFLESIRLMRKAKIINYTVNKEIFDLKLIRSEEINNMKQLEFNMKNNQKFFFIYIDCLKHYLQELANIKRKEQDHLSELKSQKQIIRKIIEKRYTSIKNMKEKLINLKGLKKFLVQVKFGKSIDKLPYNIRKEYGFSSDEEKEKEKIKETKRSSIIPQNIMNSDSFKKKFFSLYSSRKKSIKRPSVIAKSVHNLNNNSVSIFDNPEQFMSCFEFKSDRIKENLKLYWKKRLATKETMNDYEKILLENEKFMEVYLPEEEKLLKILSYQKRRNLILNYKLKAIMEMNKTEQNHLKNIASKLKNIILNIQSEIDIKSFIKERNLKLVLSSENHNKTDEAIKLAKYLLKLLEFITEILISTKISIKNNKKLKEFYRKINNEIEKTNILNRYKLQALLSIKNAEEKNQRVFDKIAKLRIGSVLQNSRRSYKEQIPEKILLKRKLEKKGVKKYKNEYEEATDLFTYT